MKASSKLMHLGAAMVITSGNLFWATTTLAVADPTPMILKSFCANLGADSQKISASMADHASKLTSARISANTKRQQDRAAFDAKVSADRLSIDAKRQQNFTVLEAKATTDVQKQAVQSSEAVVLAAVTTHRNAIDTARDAYRSAIDQAIVSRRNQVDGYLAAYKTAVTAAESSAETSCASGFTPTSVHATFVDVLKIARTTLSSNINNVAKLDPAVKSQAATRTTAVSQANTTFNKVVNQAAATLKAALSTK